MEQSINPVHTLIWFISFFGVIISIIQMLRHRDNWGYIIAPFSYILNVFLYNLALHLVFVWNIVNINSQSLEIWSAVVRLHSLLLAIAYIIIQPKKKVKGEKVE